MRLLSAYCAVALVVLSGGLATAHSSRTASRVGDLLTICFHKHTYLVYSPPELGGSSSRIFAGSFARTFAGSSARTSTRSSQPTAPWPRPSLVAVRVIDVLPDGTLRVCGDSCVVVDGVQHTVHVTGEVCKSDIDSKNFVDGDLVDHFRVTPDPASAGLYGSAGEEDETSFLPRKGL